MNLVLENGKTFEGVGFGSLKECVAELMKMYKNLIVLINKKRYKFISAIRERNTFQSN